MGFGLKNFAGSYESPVEAVAGLLGLMGASWGVAEKLLYFVPFAVLSFVAPWIFAREVLRSNRWAVLSALIFGSNTYFLVFITGGQLYLGVAEALGPIVLFAVLRCVVRLSPRWALAAGLLLGLQAAYEVRIAYLTVLMTALLLGVSLLAGPTGRIALRRIALVSLVGLVFAGTQAYWALPFLTYRGDHGLPVAAGPWLAFMRLSHGITGEAPYWTGQAADIFKMTMVHPWFFLFPLVAFTTLLLRRPKVEYLWLSLAALLAAFLIKQTNPPAGQIYTWMFFHFPGWSLFREASKLYFIVALAYAVLIPAALRHLLAGDWRMPSLRLPERIAAGAALIAVVFLSASNFLPLEEGQLGYTTGPIPMPQSFSALYDMLRRDHSYGAVLWIGGPLAMDSVQVYHTFPLRSSTHPVVELLDDNNDPLTAFCRNPEIVFCYVDKQLFPYLIDRTGTGYVIAPAGEGVGRLPVAPYSTVLAIQYPVLLDRLIGILGQPTVLGAGPHALAVWRHEAGSPVALAAASAVVEGNVRDTASALPALLALGIPATYRSPGSGGAGRQPLDSVEVFPVIDGGFTTQSRRRLAFLAPTDRPYLEVTKDGEAMRLPLVMQPAKLSGWGAYGPTVVEAGRHNVLASGLVVGPGVDWSPLANEVLQAARSTVYPDSVTVGAESVAIGGAPLAHPWVELRRTYDLAWSNNMAASNVVGDGLFNLFYVTGDPSRQLFTFTTAKPEMLGVWIAVAWSAATVIALILLAKRRRRPPEPSAYSAPKESESTPKTRLNQGALYACVTGLLLIGVAAVCQTLGWAGTHSVIRSIGSAATARAYDAADYYTALAMVALGASLALHLADVIHTTWRSAFWRPAMPVGADNA
jgi:hypothetical protein